MIWKYKAHFLASQESTAAAGPITGALGCDERTVRRMVAAFEGVTGSSCPVEALYQLMQPHDEEADGTNLDHLPGGPTKAQDRQC